MVGSWLRRFRWWLLAAVVAVAGTVAALVAVLSSSAPAARVYPAARTRATIDFTVCVLTDARGVSGAAAPVWQGVLAAQTSTNLRAQYLPAAGDGTVDAAVVGLNTLVSRGCGLVIAVGEVPVRAVWKQAGVFPATHFVVVGEPSGSGANVAVVGGGTAELITARVKVLAVDAVGGRFRSGPAA